MASATYRSPILDAAPGAVEATGPDAGVAAHYGDPLREQRALAAGDAVVDLSHKGVLTVTGLDRLTWLTTLSSQVLTDVVPGDSSETLFLTIQGRVEAAPHVVDDGTTVWLVVEPGEATFLKEWLESMRFALRVDVADRSDDVAVVGATRVPEHVAVLSSELTTNPVPGHDPDPAAALPLVWEDPWPGVTNGGWGYATDDDHPGRQRPWHEVLVPRASLVDALTGPAADGLGLAGSWAAEALRIEAWRPRALVDADDRTVPHELDWLRTAVHLQKGCYKGQETVARVHNLGHPPRRLTFLDLDGSEHTVPPAGSEVLAGDRVVGRVTSAQMHHEAGPIALAVLKRSVDPAAQLRVRSTAESTDASQAPGNSGTAVDEQWAAAQTVVVPPEAGQTVQREKGFLRGPRG